MRLLFIYFFKGFFFPKSPEGGVGMWVRKRGRSPPRLRGHPAVAAGALRRRSPAPRFHCRLCQAGSLGRLPGGMGMDLRAAFPRA